MDRLYCPPDNVSIPDEVVSYRSHNFSNLGEYRTKRDGRLHYRRNRDIAIFIDGACARNGTPYASAGIGVYFGPHSRYNLSQPLESAPHTNQRAELGAAIAALRKVTDLLWDGLLRTRKVVLITDSMYLVKGMSEWVYKWKDNGWVNCKGFAVTNRLDFEELDELIESLDDDYGVEVQFWHVPRDYNEEADDLARDAVDSQW